MADLIVVRFDDRDAAQAVQQKVLRLRREGIVNLTDFVLASRDGQGRTKIAQLISVVPKTAAWGAMFGALWGSLIGLYVSEPAAGVASGLALGAAIGGLLGKIVDYGLGDGFIKSVSDRLHPGQTALLMLIRKFDPQDLFPEIAGHGGRVLRSSLSPRQTRTLQVALTSKPCELLG